MLKRTRIISLGLAAALFAAQPVHGEVLITPLDIGAVYQEQISEQETKEETSEPGIPASEQGSGAAGTQSAGPGYQQEERIYATDQSLKTPEIAAEAAIIYDATHDQVLFEKNGDEKLYPASITKLMTALLVLENAGLDETVTFSKTAVTQLESGAVTLGLSEGDKVSVKDCLYGLLVRSANEVANGLAEHVGGSISGFAAMMNKKAAELGCTDTHFVNPNGLNDPEHYTTCRDMAKIAKAAFENKTLCEISSTLSYQFPAVKNAAARTITPGHKMLYPSDSRYYEGIIGGKTGYTSLAGNTLVTCAERDGVRMIAVVLKARSTHYTDTKALLDYGFEKAAAVVTEAAPSNYWLKDGEAWKFILSDGTVLKDCTAAIDGTGYGFDADGKMVTGWKKYGENWYFFGQDGAMVKNEWMTNGGKWFYLGSDGIMMRNAWIDDQYYVGADGSWVQQ